MGFTSAFYTYQKFTETTFKNIEALNSYFNYQDNAWAKEKFATVNAYLEYLKLDIGNNIEDKINFYKDYYIDREYNKSILEEKFSTCSDGVKLYNFIKSFKKEIYEDVYEISYKDLMLILNWAWNNFSNYIAKSVRINNCFSDASYNDETDEEIKVVKRCDGVELIFEDDSFKRVYTSAEYYDDSGLTILDCPDIYEYEFYKSLINALFDMINSVDFETCTLIYIGGY